VTWCSIIRIHCTRQAVWRTRYTSSCDAVCCKSWRACHKTSSVMKEWGWRTCITRSTSCTCCAWSLTVNTCICCWIIELIWNTVSFDTWFGRVKWESSITGSTFNSWCILVVRTRWASCRTRLNNAGWATWNFDLVCTS